jgi:hypothetical protein
MSGTHGFFQEKRAKRKGKRGKRRGIREKHTVLYKEIRGIVQKIAVFWGFWCVG